MSTILPLKPPYIDAAFDLLTREFIARSQPHRALSIGLDEYRAHLLPGYRHMVNQGHSFVAVDARDEVIACLLACDYCKATAPQSDSVSSASHRMQPLLALLAELDRTYRNHRQIVADQILLVDMAVVSPVASGLGLYRRLRETVHDHGRRCGFERVVGELSSAATQHVCIDVFNHQVIGRVNFATFVHDGQRPFSALIDPPDVVLVEGKL